MAGDNSFLDLQECLARGDAAGAEEIFRRFAPILIGRASRRLPQRLKRKVDPEDLVQSAFRTFFRRQSEGEFELSNWEGLWGLLLRITLRKCSTCAEHYGAARRNVQQEVAQPPLDQSMMDWSAAIPLPDETAALNELLDSLQSRLDPLEWNVFSLRLQEYTVPEICLIVNRSQRTVARVLQRARELLAKELGEGEDEGAGAPGGQGAR